MRYHRFMLARSLALVIFVLLIACSGPSSTNSTAQGRTATQKTPEQTLLAPTSRPSQAWTGCLAPISSTERHSATLTLSDFAFLQRGMRLAEIDARVGSPDQVVGFGLYIFVYYLADGGRVELTFGNPCYLEFAAYHYAGGRGGVLVPWEEPPK